MKFRGVGIFGLGFVMALILIGGGAYAANGGAVILGRGNLATAPTGINNSNGTALVLTSGAGKPSVVVNSKARVANLNADFLDGVDSTALSLKAGRTGIIKGSATDADGFENTARCPAGTYATGGGGFASGDADFLYYSGPDFDQNFNLIPNSWFASGQTASLAFIECYNPRGAVPGAATSLGVAPGGGASTSGAADHPTQKSFPTRQG